MPTFALLFGLRTRVGRKPYIAWGLGLAVLKFLVDTAIVYAFTHKVWSPLGYVVPSTVLRQGAVGASPEPMALLLPLAALPFLWIGLSMSVRRAADAGIAPWWGTLFVVPVVNYVVILVLAALPSKPSARWEPPALPIYRRPDAAAGAPPSTVSLPPGARAALQGVAASMGIGVAMIGISVYGLEEYGVALFFVTPLTMGVVTAVLYNREVLRSFWTTLQLAVAGVCITGAAVLLFAIEGVLCLIMAAPIAIFIAVCGAAVAYAVMASTRGERPALAMLLIAPGVAFGESRLAAPTARDVSTSIEIDAPPEQVWPNVVGFSDLDEPPEWFFRLGIAYPKRARIDGAGVGAVRRCEFSTGPFVEPITVWSPPDRLAFDVTSQPPSMTEWSPYRAVHAPHLEGYMVSRGGEFDLVRLPGGRTRLEGTTHYTLAVYPELYWVPYAEVLLHAIHHRVLLHIKHLSEK
jgi:uncharacterized membrane protein YhaH (DUF805 family)